MLLFEVIQLTPLFFNSKTIIFQELMAVLQPY